ncbi:MAG: hypothetical protein GEV06_16525 [Luteitalea sp.]|nr:hypothetical protein [Luteitalea sp.]
MTLLLAIDGGGTGTRCIAVDPGGRTRGDGRAGPSNHLHVPLVTATEALRMATSEALSKAGATIQDVALVSAGLAGVDFDGTGADTAAGMLRSIGFGRVVVHGDMVIAHRGALAGDPGVVALAGTGSAVLGITRGGATIKAGGWGPLYDDQGSAYQLGRLGLVAAAEAFDGSGPATALVERLTAALGASNLPDTVARLYGTASGQQRVAALAPVVTACADEGDDVAAAICGRAGAALARAVLAVIRRLHALEAREGRAAGGAREAPACLASYQGAVLERSGLVRAAFLETVRAGEPQVEVRPPRFAPIVGAVLLGMCDAKWDLRLESLETASGV